MEICESDADSPLPTAEIVGPEWNLQNYLQLLQSPDAECRIVDICSDFETYEHGEHQLDDPAPGTDQEPSASSPSRLSAIPEGSNEDAESAC